MVIGPERLVATMEYDRATPLKERLARPYAEEALTAVEGGVSVALPA